MYAIFHALLVTFLWSTSWILIKIGLQNRLPPLTFAGFRYTLASLVLAPCCDVRQHGVGGNCAARVGSRIQGLGQLGLLEWSIIAWLALVNIALAFTLWNHILRRLTATESSIVNGAKLPQVAIMA